MALIGKRVAQIEIKSSGDVYHHLWKANPHQIPNLSPTNIQNSQILDGVIGCVGCLIQWNYFHDGKDRIAKTLIVAIDEEKKLTTFKLVEGDLLQLYKNFTAYLQVEKKGVNNLVTWTVEYEKLSPNVPDPDSFMEFYKRTTKDIEAKHLKK